MLRKFNTDTELQKPMLVLPQKYSKMLEMSQKINSFIVRRLKEDIPSNDIFMYNINNNEVNIKHLSIAGRIINLFILPLNRYFVISDIGWRNYEISTLKHQ